MYRVYDRDMKSGEVISKLKQDGWQLVNTRGSHAQYKHPDKPNKVTVPHPKKDLPIGTLKSIFKQAGWDWDSRSRR